MSIVTNIEPQKDGKRVNVFLDHEFGFGIDLDNLVILGIKIGKEISEDELDKIVKTAEYKKLFDKFLNFLILRPRSEKECFDYFIRKKISDLNTKERFIKSAYKLLLLDDLKFAKWWVEQRSQFRPKGKMVLKMELSKKGIDKEIISKVLEEVEIDEKSIAMSIAQRKLKGLGRYSDEKKYEKIFGFLARRGFGQTIIRAVIDELGLRV